MSEVLIADDEEAVCFALKRVLERRGHTAHVAADGRSAVELVRARGERLAVAFLDVVMPRLGGFAALHEIRALAPGVRCCLMTAHRHDAAVDRSLNESTALVLDKPFALDEFTSALDHLLAEAPPANRSAVAQPFQRVLILVPPQAGVWAGVVRGVARYARPDKPWLIAVHPEDELPAALTGCDGVIACVRCAAVSVALGAWGGPVVDAAGGFAKHPFPRVGFDAAAAGALAAEHLLQLGGRRFAFVGAPGDETGDGLRRGYTSRLGCACVTAAAELAAGTLETLSAWLLALPRPAAVLADTDARALRLGEACRLAGLRVPEDVALLGVTDDEVLCFTAYPPLSSVRLPAEAVGFEAARVLDGLMGGGRAPSEPIALPPVGVTARQSTDVTAVADPELAVALRFIRDHAAERIGVDDVVAASALSRSSLERRFRALLGRSPLAELLRVRVARAEQLLAETDQSVDEVARAVGFRDAGHLTATFRVRGNLTPAQFRVLHRRP